MRIFEDFLKYKDLKAGDVFRPTDLKTIYMKCEKQPGQPNEQCVCLENGKIMSPELDMDVIRYDDARLILNTFTGGNDNGKTE